MVNVEASFARFEQQAQQDQQAQQAQQAEEDGLQGCVVSHEIKCHEMCFGVVVAELTRRRFRSHPAIHWRQIVIALEIAILGLVALLPTGEWDTAANVLVSFVCAVQVQSFRKIRGNPCATTMCTGNLRSGTELLFHAVQDHDPTARRRGLQYYAIILLFILGAFLGVWCTEQWRGRAVLVCCGLLAVVFSAMFLKSGEEALEA